MRKSKRPTNSKLILENLNLEPKGQCNKHPQCYSTKISGVAPAVTSASCYCSGTTYLKFLVPQLSEATETRSINFLLGHKTVWGARTETWSPDLAVLSILGSGADGNKREGRKKGALSFQNALLLSPCLELGWTGHFRAQSQPFHSARGFVAFIGPKAESEMPPYPQDT